MVNKNVNFKMFALLTFQHAQEDSRKLINSQQDALKLYKKAWHRIFNLKADEVKKFFEEDHPIHAAYENFLKGEDSYDDKQE